MLVWRSLKNDSIRFMSIDMFRGVYRIVTVDQKC